MYDPQLGRWMNIDPLAERFHEWSPYVFAFNNPILFNDPTGMAPEPGNTLDNVQYNEEDKTYTITETRTVVGIPKTDVTSTFEGGPTLETTTTNYSVTNSTTVVDSEGNILSSESTTTNHKETTTKTFNSEGEQIGSGTTKDKITGVTNGTNQGAFAEIAAWSLNENGSFPIWDDASIMMEIDGELAKTHRSSPDGVPGGEIGIAIVLNNAGNNKYNLSARSLNGGDKEVFLHEKYYERYKKLFPYVPKK